MNTNFTCSCGWRGTEDQMEPECIDFGDRYQPPEWTNRCPSCGNDWENMTETPVCRTCEDTFVQHEGDQCEICRQEALEMMCEAMATEGER